MGSIAKLRPEAVTEFQTLGCATFLWNMDMDMDMMQY